MWDTEVDVAFIGAGVGGLANAIATVDAGGDVLVADVTPAGSGDVSPVAIRARIDARRGWLAHDILDDDTGQYFAALCDGLAESTPLPGDASVPVRIARNLSQEELNARTVEPFVGARVNDWAAECLSSRYGMLYTSMKDWRSTTMRAADGDSIEVMRIGAVEWCDGFGESALRQWMSEQARQRDIEVLTSTALQRIVFEDGVIVGVVLSTPDGPYAVKVRSGITFAPSDQDASIGEAIDRHSGESLQVCLVGRTASRFVRVELLTTEPGPSRPMCTGSHRQLRDGLHEGRLGTVDGLRCGKVHGYPPIGQ